MEKNSITSTSRTSAKCSDVSLRGGERDDISRLVFRPELVDNPHDAKAAVRGTFVYQRKGRDDRWDTITTERLTSLKKGEGYKLELRAAEVLKLFQYLAELYRVYAKDGIPYGTREYVRADTTIGALLEIPRQQLRQYLTANRAIGEKLLGQLLFWASEIDDPQPLVSRLISLGDNALRSLNVAIGLGTLKKALSIWEQNKGNTKEEFWQQTLTEQSFVLEQVFSWPTTIVKGKAYVGGKSVLNEGGNVVDFLVENFLTKNAALVEIKTPKTSLLGGRYRNTYNVSEDLGGSVMQILNYKFSLQREFLNLSAASGRRFEAFDPRCVVILGSTAQVKTDPDKLGALELYRSSCSAVTVITFDELFAKTRRLITVLETAS